MIGDYDQWMDRAFCSPDSDAVEESKYDSHDGRSEGSEGVAHDDRSTIVAADGLMGDWNLVVSALVEGYNSILVDVQEGLDHVSLVSLGIYRLELDLDLVILVPGRWRFCPYALHLSRRLHLRSNGLVLPERPHVLELSGVCATV